MIRILEETGLPPNYLELELTESSIMQNAEFAAGMLNRLKSMGINISIDDFGTGFSSLASLKRLPIDALKIDQSFVRDATSDPDDAALVMAIITLAHNLRLKVIAEGVETGGPAAVSCSCCAATRYRGTSSANPCLPRHWFRCSTTVLERGLHRSEKAIRGIRVHLWVYLTSRYSKRATSDSPRITTSPAFNGVSVTRADFGSFTNVPLREF